MRGNLLKENVVPGSSGVVVRTKMPVALMFVMDDQIAKADQLDGRNALVRAVKKMLDADIDVLRKHLRNPKGRR